MDLTLDQALQKGVEAHKAGKAQEADRYYTAILKADPKHPDANHNMGVLAVGLGKVEIALPFFKTALDTNPNIDQFWLSYIDALIKLDRLSEAKAVFERAKSQGANGSGFEKIELQLSTPSVELINQSQSVIPTQPNILDELKLDKALKLAKKKVIDGLNEEAKQIYLDILKKFPPNKKASEGIHRLSVQKSTSANSLQEPSQTELQALIDLHSEGRLHQTLKWCEDLIQQYPKSAVLFNIKGAVFNGLGQFDSSVAAYDKAISIKPDFVDAYNNMGVTFQYQGKLDEAIDAFTKALSIKSDFAEAHNNMGVTFQDQGKLKEAIDAYAEALSIKPDYVEACNNMGNALYGVKFTKYNPKVAAAIILILDHRIIARPKNIAVAALSLLKCQPELKSLFSEDLIENLDQTFDKIIYALSKTPMLLKLMNVCPLPDLDFEQLLSNLRSFILLNISSLKMTPDLLKFQSALALQCFTNEYVYNYTEEEENILQSLDAKVKKAIQNNEYSSSKVVLALASYKALHEYDWSDHLQNNPDIQDVFIRQIEEPQKESELKSQIPVLGEITNKVSSKVREQYEENPYPRWINLGLSLKPMSITEVIKDINLKLSNVDIVSVRAPEILIAGCGTGQHSIGTACRFKDSTVLAVDLSLSSLAYAKRKTQELTIRNIEYMQADILDLGQLNKQFDIIESSGVLHHMDNPMAGWKILTDCLKPGGLMKIGLYSELARYHIISIRKEISKLDLEPDQHSMRKFRNNLLQSEDPHHKLIITSNDFYSLSKIRFDGESFGVSVYCFI